MKINGKLYKSVITLFTLCFANTVFGRDIPNNIPVGQNIDPLAGNCNIGPFPKTSKAGMYNQYCNVLSDAEKCTAFITSHLYHTGAMASAHNPDIAKYCLYTLQNELLKTEVND